MYWGLSHGNPWWIKPEKFHAYKEKANTRERNRARANPVENNRKLMEWRAKNPQRYRHCQSILYRAAAPRINARIAEKRAAWLASLNGPKPKRGDIHPETGLIYWDWSGGNERWLTKEKFYQWREKSNRSSQKWAKSNPEKSGGIKKKWTKKNPEKCRERTARWRIKNPDKLRDIQRRSVRKNIRSIIAKKNIREKERKLIDPVFRLACNARSRVRGVIRRCGFVKTCKTEQMLGCDWATLKSHIEGQFVDGMGWDNYGKWHEHIRRWNVDHIAALAQASTIEELMPLLHYTNLRPMWAKENNDKSDFLPCGTRARDRRKKVISCATRIP